MQSGSVNMLDVYYVLRALAANNMLDGEVTKALVEHLVRRGFDADDMLNLSDGRVSGYRRGIHYLLLVATSKSDMRNKHFLNHANTFA